MFKHSGQDTIRASSRVRHDFDSLQPPPRPRIALRRVLSADFQPLAQLARKTIGEGLSSLDTVRDILGRNPNSVLVFERDQEAVGFWAMLMLTSEGLEALLTAEFNPLVPDSSRIVSTTESPAAIYVWAVVAKGLASEGIGHVSAFLRQPLYVRANLYTRAATEAGGIIMNATGFVPIKCAMGGLHRYVRHANRPSSLATPLTVAA
jgi:hypothetical protein